ncbi:hypothetical protein C7974DRAFT_428369 [Boeremia exigua]|uniref:uncharacterized protein n=1 Tax=Boeremia exigua TaxID=749465 RepID=UPI001E8E9E24|nr:uncharacterized protein C7974DRAFT_428369 [Boeremia exigua]KAH6613902.1 hypothetical protein C7974DRAFT_428369 [Boeremia exigua]
MGLFKALALLALGTSTVVAKPYPVHDEELMRLHNATQLEKRVDCPGGVSCGWDNWLCCPAGSSCVTDASDQAQCGGAPSGGYAFYTTTWVETVGAVTRTSVGSTLVGGGTTAAACGNSQSPCGSVCCDSGLYCKDPSVGTCAMIAGGSSGGILPTGSASAPVRPTSSTLVIVTYTGAPTATVPFQTAVPTGASGSLTETGASNGLSGGAIAGIVIGVLLGILILFLICLFCCARALFDTLLGILGLGKKRKHTHEETTYIEDHHHAGGAAGGRWYGQGPGRPSRPASEKKSGIGKGMGMAAALGGLALALGLKKKHDRRDDKSTTISGSSAYYSDYTSSSSASSDDRHTRHTRHSSRR